MWLSILPPNTTDNIAAKEAQAAYDRAIAIVVKIREITRARVFDEAVGVALF